MDKIVSITEGAWSVSLVVTNFRAGFDLIGTYFEELILDLNIDGFLLIANLLP